MVKCFEFTSQERNCDLKFKFDDGRQTLCCDLSPESAPNMMCTGGSGGYLRTYDLTVQKFVQTLGPAGEMKSRLFDCKYSPKDFGNVIFSGGWDDIVHVSFDLTTKNGIARYIKQRKNNWHSSGNLGEFFTNGQILFINRNFSL